jgi:hypothetical protein
MTVGLTPEQEDACRSAIMPIPLTRAQTVADACASMSTVLPLIVIVDEKMPRPDVDAMGEFITACGAELVPLDHALAGKALAKRLLDAIVVAERRRMGRPR